MSARSKKSKPEDLSGENDFSVEGVLSQNKSDPRDLIETVVQACIDSSQAGSSQTLAGLNAANEERKEYKSLLFYACILLWVICMLTSLFILYFPSTSVTDETRTLAATAALQTLPSLAFGFLVGKSTE